MRIAYLDTWWPLSREAGQEFTQGVKGHHEWVLSVLKELRKNGHEVVFFAPGADGKIEDTCEVVNAGETNADWILVNWPGKTWSGPDAQQRWLSVCLWMRNKPVIVFMYDVVIYDELIDPKWMVLTFSPDHKEWTKRFLAGQPSERVSVQSVMNESRSDY